MKRNHLPKHLQPVRIPRIRVQKKRNHSAIRRYAFFMIFALGVSFFEKEKDKKKKIMSMEGRGY